MSACMTNSFEPQKVRNNMWLCKRDLSKECERNRDCIDCVLDKIRAEIEQFDSVSKNDVLQIIDKYRGIRNDNNKNV